MKRSTIIVLVACSVLVALLATLEFTKNSDLRYPQVPIEGSVPGISGDTGDSAGTSGATSKMPGGDWKGARIVEEGGVTYRINADGTRVALGENDARIIVENSVRYRIDPGGTRVRVDEQGLNVDIDDPEIVVPNNAELAEYCPILQDDATLAECDYFNRVWSKLQAGAGAISAPDKMIQGETATVSFAIVREASVEAADLLGEAPDQEFSTKVGRRMAAQLEGEGFKVEPSGLQHRDLFVGPGARWSWKITALKAPKHSLRLSAFVVVASMDGTKPRENLLKTVKRDIKVRVTWGQWFDEWLVASTEWLTKGTNWLKAAAAFLLALLALLAIFRRKKEPPPSA